MREHRDSADFPHSAERLWALMQDCERWPDYAPMAIAVEILHPGDETGSIYAFINKKNEESMRSLSRWLTDHPGYCPDLVQPD